jgi:hypothetical protein
VKSSSVGCFITCNSLNHTNPSDHRQQVASRITRRGRSPQLLQFVFQKSIGDDQRLDRLTRIAPSQAAMAWSAAAFNRSTSESGFGTIFATGRAQAANSDGFRFGTPQFLAAFDLNQCFDKSWAYRFHRLDIPWPAIGD